MIIMKINKNDAISKKIHGRFNTLQFGGNKGINSIISVKFSKMPMGTIYHCRIKPGKIHFMGKGYHRMPLRVPSLLSAERLFKLMFMCVKNILKTFMQGNILCSVHEMYFKQLIRKT